jgi:hypothetical protein
MNQEIQNILNHAKRMGATHFIEMWCGDETGFDSTKREILHDVENLECSLSDTADGYGLRTSHVFLIKAKKSEAQKV